MSANLTYSLQVLCRPPTNTVSAGISMPRPARIALGHAGRSGSARWRGRSARRLRRRTPRSRGPTRAGCSCCASRARGTIRAERSFWSSPMSRNTRSPMPAISSTVNPTPPLCGLGVGSVRSKWSRVALGGRTNSPALRLNRAVRPGNSTRATSGIDASTPNPADRTAPSANVRVPTCNWCEARPSARRTRRVRRSVSCWPSATCSST